MTTESLGLYIHIPFCLKKCRYCDFCSSPSFGTEARERYIKRLTEEIGTYRAAGKLPVDTVFFGGGTPSLLTPRETEKILSAIAETFVVFPDAEISVEANPKTVTREKLSEYRRLGINRISIGLQSINENEQKILGRIHNADDFYRAVQDVASAGFDNFNVDIMYGIPAQTEESFARTLDTVLSVHPAHVSAYSLILEKGTPLYKERRTLPLPTEDEEIRMVDLLGEKLARAGIFRYEISNYAKAGYACRHNLKYWRGEDYIGVGMAAASCFRGVRYVNTTKRDEYFSDSYAQYRQSETLTEADRRFEYVMLRLRLCEGFSLADYRERFGADFRSGREEKLEELKNGGYMKEEGGRLFLTTAGLYVSNTILSQIL